MQCSFMLCMGKILIIIIIQVSRLRCHVREAEIVVL